ncbi:MAG: hypothetical protein [Caudoviricetes sp.]|nr:MAG: hypothetical protein [Caudoviricetes sp.]
MKSYTFWFCSNRMYNSDGVYRATWWNKLFLIGGLIHKATCTIHGCDSAEEALEHAVESFRENGFSRQIMGHEY